MGKQPDERASFRRAQPKAEHRSDEIQQLQIDENLNEQFRTFRLLDSVPNTPGSLIGRSLSLLYRGAQIQAAPRNSTHPHAIEMPCGSLTDFSLLTSSSSLRA